MVDSVKRSTLASAALTGAVMMVAAASAAGAGTGSGASFPALVYTDWCQNIGCSYTSKGSSGGIQDFIAGTVDFAGSDAIMSSDQVSDLAAKRGGVSPLYFPTVLGAITVPTNTSAGRLRLDGKVLGEIFSGGITKWNDSRITRLNRGKSLPNADITVCVRSDGSGTSYGFTNYLNKVSLNFRKKVGAASQTPAWTAPRIVRGAKNPGVAQCIKDNSNSIGYVDLGDAQNAGLASNIAAIGKYERRTVRIKKRVKVRGKVVVKRVRVKRTKLVFSLPSVKTISAAGTLRSYNLSNPAKIQRDLVNSTATGAYPITITTFVLAYSSFAKAGKSGSIADTKAFLNYAYGAGQRNVTKFAFAPLPKGMLAAAKTRAAALK